MLGEPDDLPGRPEALLGAAWSPDGVSTGVQAASDRAGVTQPAGYRDGFDRQRVPPRKLGSEVQLASQPGEQLRS